MIERKLQQESAVSWKERCTWAAVLLFVALLASAPLFSANHILHGFDLVFHLGRIEGLRDALLSGQFPVRVNPVHLGGYGMPTDIFYPDFFLYFPALLRMAGVPLLACWKAYLVMVNLLTVFASWWAFAVYTRSVRAGAVAAVVYEVFLFRLIMIYIASAAASPLAMAFLPGALVSIWVTLRRDVSYWPAVVIFSTGILLSHIVTAVFLMAAMLLMVLASFRRFAMPEVRWAAAKSAVFIFLMNLWFYAPLWYFQQHMDYEMKSVTHREIAYDYIYYLREGDFYMGSGLLLILAAVCVYLFLHREKMHKKEFCLLMAGSAAILILVSRPWPWHAVGHWAGLLQFPSRLTVFPMMFLSVVIARGAEAFGLAKRWHCAAVIVCLIAALGGSFLWMSGRTYSIPPQPRENQRLVMTRSTVGDYLAHLDYAYSGYKDYMDVATRDHIMNAPSSVEDKEEKMRMKFRDREIHPADRIRAVQRNGNDFVLDYADGASGWVQLPIFWYIGYTAAALSTGETYTVRKDEDGQVSVLLPSGEGRVHVWYGGLPWFHLTDLVSWFSFVAFLYVAARSWQRGEVLSCRRG